jgi:hypothetical protein
MTTGNPINLWNLRNLRISFVVICPQMSPIFADCAGAWRKSETVGQTPSMGR